MSRRLRTAEILAAAGLASSDLERERQQTEREGMRQRGYLQALSALVPAGAQLASTLYGLEADKTAKAAKLADSAAATERQRTQDSLNEENIRSQMTSRTAADERAIAAEARAAAESARKAETEATARASKAQEDAMGGLRLRAASGAPLEALIGAASADDRLGDLDDDAVRGIQAEETRKSAAAKAKEAADLALANERNKPRGGGGPSSKPEPKEPKVIKPALTPAEVESVLELQGARDMLGRLEQMKLSGGKEGAEIDTGPFAALKSFFASKAGVADPRMVKFKALAGEQIASYIKSISGATVSESERRSLLENIPSAADDDEEFMGKLQSVKDTLDAKLRLKSKAYAATGRDTAIFGEGVAPAAPVAAASSAPRRFRVSNGQRALVVDEAKLPDALADGFRVLEEVR